MLFHEKITCLKIFEKFLCLGVPPGPSTSEILSNCGIFILLTLMYFLIKNCTNIDVKNDVLPHIFQNLTFICVVNAILWSFLISTTMWCYSLNHEYW